MITIHYWPTPNGHKVTLFCEEAGLPYTIAPVNIGKGEQFKPSFLSISPNNRMPAIVDDEPQGGGKPISIFESGAILMYLAEKTGKFLPKDLRARVEVMEWLVWQVANVGPMFGQAGHFRNYASEKIPYAIDRYTNEVDRLYGVLDRRLDGHDYLCGDYSIADMACFPWMSFPDRFGMDMAHFPNAAKWLERIRERPAVKRALAKGEEIRSSSAPMDEEAKKILFGQTTKGIAAHTAKHS